MAFSCAQAVLVTLWHLLHLGKPLVKEKILDALAEAMPTDRKKEEVPRWLVLAANLSLKLRLENSSYAFQRVVRCGGLLSALPPEIASKHLGPKAQQILCECRGFSDKSHYARATPCDQDFCANSSGTLLLPIGRPGSTGPSSGPSNCTRSTWSSITRMLAPGCHW